MKPPHMCFLFNSTATTEIYTLSLHDALPIFGPGRRVIPRARFGVDRRDLSACDGGIRIRRDDSGDRAAHRRRSEEHTSELQSQSNLVCRLLLEKKKSARERAAPICPLKHCLQ